MKILHLNYSSNDGAGRAVSRIHRALLEQQVDSAFLYLRPHDSRVSPFSLFGRKINGIKNILLGFLTRGNAERGYPSLNLFPTKVLEAINASDADIVHLHWVHGEMISIAQISKINKPLAWTCHDMWPFCGAAHWAMSGKEEECSVNGYAKTGRAGLGLDQWVYRRKEKHWRNLNAHIVTPSNWMADCVRKSVLFGSRPVEVIPNCLDLNIFTPLPDKAECRRQFGLPQQKQVILYGATQPGALRKGGDLIGSILKKLPTKDKYVFAVFGSSSKAIHESQDTTYGVETYNLGFIRDEQEMARLYNAADVMCVPSRLDNLPSVCVEALACGLPVVAFRIGGIPDIIEHKTSGYLAEPFDQNDFCDGIQWSLDSSAGADKLSFQNLGQARAKELFSNQTVAEKHINLYRNILCG